MKLSALILAFGVLYAQQSPAEWWQQANQKQRWSIGGSYERNKTYDKGLTLAAFNAIESSGGLHLFRLSSLESGLYSQKGYNVAKRENKQKRLRVSFDSLWIYVYKKMDNPSDWQVSRAVQRLIQDREFDDRHARAHIDELLDRYNGDWQLVWQGWNSQKEKQAEEVKQWVLFFRYKLKWD